jgi:hypothetical protein
MSEPTTLLPLNLRAGFWALLLFATLGLLLEIFHGLKLGFYLDVSNETRRLLWRLGHAHGALLGLVNICYALAARGFPRLEDALAERALLSALLLMPLGFLLGGAFAQGGDPGASVGLAVAGGVALLVGLARIARKVT